MSDFPAPLTPADCDLRGLEFMPLDTVRLLDSDLFAISTGEEFKAAVALWCKSWVQVPAASLPDDDRILAHLSGAGTRWKKVRDMALRGWVKCDDGRLYHPVVAEKALGALPRRRAHQEATSSEAARKERERDDRKRMFADLKEAGQVLPWNTKTSELRERHAKLSQKQAGTGHGESVTCHEPVTPPVTAKTGRGTGTIPPTPIRSVTGDPVQAVMKAGRFVSPPNDSRLVHDWLALPNMELERDILPIVERVAGEVIEREGRGPFKFRLFDQPIRAKHAEDEAELVRLRQGRERIERMDREQRAASGR